MKVVTMNLAYHSGKAAIHIGEYTADGSPAIKLYDPDTREPIATATVCVKGSELKPGEVCIKSWSENEGMEEELQRLGIIGPMKRFVPTGWVQATVHDLLAEGLV